LTFLMKIYIACLFQINLT